MVARYVVSPRGGRRTYPDITSALRAAAGRGRAALIEIAPGTYEEYLVVRGEVRLLAVDGPGSVVVSRPRGPVLETSGAVRVEGLVLAGRDTEVDTVACQAGTLTLEHAEVRTPGGAGTHARPNTHVTLRDSVLRHGRTVFTASAGLIERCRFTDAADNAIAVIEGARVAVRDSRIEGSLIHGVRVCDAQAEVTGCELTGTGSSALAADTRAELAVADCAITAVQAEGVTFAEQSRGSVARTSVTDARHGIAVASGANPVVRGCTLTDCHDTGINVQTSARGTFEDCHIVRAGNVAVFSTTGGTPEVHGCRISGGNVGIALTDGGRGRFTRVGIEDLAGTALRVWDGSKGVFEHVRVDRCSQGLDTTRGDGGTTADLTDVAFRDFDVTAVTALGQSRVALRRVTAERGVVGFGAAEEAQLHVHDCDVTAMGVGGVVVYGKAGLVARNLKVRGSEGTGLTGAGSAYLDVADSEFAECASASVLFADDSAGRLVNCSVPGTRGTAVKHNGRVDLVSLRTSLPVVEEKVHTVEPTPTIINQIGPVFHGSVTNSQFSWNNDNVVQQQIEGDDSRA